MPHFVLGEHVVVVRVTRREVLLGLGLHLREGHLAVLVGVGMLEEPLTAAVRELVLGDRAVLVLVESVEARLRSRLRFRERHLTVAVRIDPGAGSALAFATRKSR